MLRAPLSTLLTERSVEPCIVECQFFGQPGVAPAELAEKGVEIRARHVAAGERGGRQSSRRPCLWKEWLQLLQRVLGKLAIGRDLAAEHRKQWRRSLDIEHIVAGHGRRIGRIVIIKRPDAGEA